MNPVGTFESVWLPYYRSHLYAAYEAEDSQEVGMVQIGNNYDQILFKQIVVKVYPARPGFLVDYPHTYNVVKLQVTTYYQK